MPNMKDFENALSEIFANNGKEFLDVNSKDLHLLVGGYPKVNRLPVCCSVMRRLMQPGDVILDENDNEKGQGARLTIRYFLPRRPVVQPSLYLIYKDSWRILSDRVFIKEIDGTTFKYKSTRIPRELRRYFEIEDIKPREKREILLFYSNEKYTAVIDMDIQNPPRTEMAWRADFYHVLKGVLPEWDKYFSQNNSAENPPLLRFEKDATKGAFKVSILNPSVIEKDVITEEDEEKLIFEGSAKYLYSKRYERNPENRRKAIEFHGLNCVICDFDFQARYGEQGAGYIEIHHTKPLSSNGQPIVVNPYTDLVPVSTPI